jgi:hypothetical protein
VAGSLEINRWNGIEEPRFNVQLGYSLEDPEVLNLDLRDWETRVLHAMDSALAGQQISADVADHFASRPEGPVSKTLRSREGILSSLGVRDDVVFVVGDFSRRSEWIATRLGSARAVDWASVSDGAVEVSESPCWAVLDPPSNSRTLALVTGQGGVESYLLWGEQELRFARKLHQAETDIEPIIRHFYAALRTAVRRDQGRESLLACLEGDGRYPRTARQVGVMLCVLNEIGAIRVADDLGVIELSDPTMGLQESPTMRRLGESRIRGEAFLMSLAGAC